MVKDIRLGTVKLNNDYSSIISWDIVSEYNPAVIPGLRSNNTQVIPPNREEFMVSLSVLFSKEKGMETLRELLLDFETCFIQPMEHPDISLWVNAYTEEGELDRSAHGIDQLIKAIENMGASEGATVPIDENTSRYVEVIPIEYYSGKEGNYTIIESNLILFKYEGNNEKIPKFLLLKLTGIPLVEDEHIKSKITDLISKYLARVTEPGNTGYVLFYDSPLEIDVTRQNELVSGENIKEETWSNMTDVLFSICNSMGAVNRDLKAYLGDVNLSFGTDFSLSQYICMSLQSDPSTGIFPVSLDTVIYRDASFLAGQKRLDSEAIKSLSLFLNMSKGVLQHEKVKEFLEGNTFFSSSELKDTLKTILSDIRSQYVAVKMNRSKRFYVALEAIQIDALANSKDTAIANLNLRIADINCYNSFSYLHITVDPKKGFVHGTESNPEDSNCYVFYKELVRRRKNKTYEKEFHREPEVPDGFKYYVLPDNLNAFGEFVGDLTKIVTTTMDLGDIDSEIKNLLPYVSIPITQGDIVTNLTVVRHTPLGKSFLIGSRLPLLQNTGAVATEVRMTIRTKNVEFVAMLREMQNHSLSVMRLLNFNLSAKGIIFNHPFLDNFYLCSFVPASIYIKKDVDAVNSYTIDIRLIESKTNSDPGLKLLIDSGIDLYGKEAVLKIMAETLDPSKSPMSILTSYVWASYFRDPVRDLWVSESDERKIPLTQKNTSISLDNGYIYDAVGNYFINLYYYIKYIKPPKDSSKALIDLILTKGYGIFHDIENSLLRMEELGIKTVEDLDICIALSLNRNCWEITYANRFPDLKEEDYGTLVAIKHRIILLTELLLKNVEERDKYIDLNEVVLKFRPVYVGKSFWDQYFLSDTWTGEKGCEVSKHVPVGIINRQKTFSIKDLPYDPLVSYDTDPTADIVTYPDLPLPTYRELYDYIDRREGIGRKIITNYSYDAIQFKKYLYYIIDYIIVEIYGKGNSLHSVVHVVLMNGVDVPLFSETRINENYTKEQANEAIKNIRSAIWDLSNLIYEGAAATPYYQNPTGWRAVDDLLMTNQKYKNILRILSNDEIFDVVTTTEDTIFNRGGNENQNLFQDGVLNTELSFSIKLPSYRYYGEVPPPEKTWLSPAKSLDSKVDPGFFIYNINIHGNVGTETLSYYPQLGEYKEDDLGNSNIKIEKRVSNIFTSWNSAELVKKEKKSTQIVDREPSSKVSSIPQPYYGPDIDLYVSNITANTEARKEYTAGGKLHEDLKTELFEKETSLATKSFSRSFPTCVLYFVEEDSEQWYLFDELYQYSQISAVEIVKTKDEGSLAIVTVADIQGLLSKDQFIVLSDEGRKYVREHGGSSLELNSTTTNEAIAGRLGSLDFGTGEFFLGKLKLTAGTKVILKLGYSSTESLLSTVFIGRIAAIVGGPELTMYIDGLDLALAKPAVGSWGKLVAKMIIRDLIDDVPDFSREFGANLGLLPGYQIHPSAAINRLSGTAVGVGIFLGGGGGAATLALLALGTSATGIGVAVGAVLLAAAGALAAYNYISHRAAGATKDKDGAINVYEYTKNGEVIIPSWYGCNWLSLSINWGAHGESVLNNLKRLSKFYHNYVGMPKYLDTGGTYYLGPSSGYYIYTRRMSQEQLNLWATRKEMIESMNRGESQDLYDIDSPYGPFDFSRLNEYIEKFNNNEFYPHRILTEKSFFPNLAPDVPFVSKTYEDSEYLESEFNKLLIYRDIHLRKQDWESNFRDKIKREMESKALFISKTYPTLKNKKYRCYVLDRMSKFATSWERRIVVELLLFLSLKKEVRETGKAPQPEIMNKEYVDGRPFPNMKPLRKHHIVTSEKDIISNNIVASTHEMWNTVRIASDVDDLDDSDVFELKLDDDIRDQHKIIMPIAEENFHPGLIRYWKSGLGIADVGMDAMIWAAVNYLAEGIRYMYTGSLTIVGNPEIEPHDVIYLIDFKNQMVGPIVAREVSHHFDAARGYVTVIKPELLVSTLDKLDYQENCKAAYKASLEIIGSAFLFLGGGALGTLSKTAKVATGAGKAMETVKKANVVAQARGLTAQGIAMSLGLEPYIMNTINGWGLLPNFSGQGVMANGMRNPISFWPLLYRGVPYVAGVDGMERNSYFDHLQRRIKDVTLGVYRAYDRIPYFLRNLQYNTLVGK